MRKVSRNAVVPYSPADMFGLVDDIDAYAEFLPWCERSVVDRRHGNIVDATLVLRKGGVGRTFSTRNTNIPGRRIDMCLVSGPFRHLFGSWVFEPLGDEGCSVSLQIEFEFESRVLDAMFGRFFEETCNALIDAFVDRANLIYG